MQRRPAAAPAELGRELKRTEAYAAGTLAPATRRAYETDWRVFATWCAARGVPADPGDAGERCGVPGR